MPPRRLIDGIGSGDYRKIGNEFFRHFTQIGGLKPHHRVLDVGCGCGRMAVPMIPFLNDQGEYYGFDIVPDAIRWSQKHIARQYPRFHFALADVYNKAYNRRPKVKSTEYRFAFPDDFFDFTLATSVFSHLLAADTEHYLSEIARTLKPGGRCMMTFFLLNPETKRLMAEGKSSAQFKYPLVNCTSSSLEVPEISVAYEETFVRERLIGSGLQIVEPVHFGCWCQRGKYLSFQDIILAVKPASR